MTPTFEKTVDILVKAYLNDTLEHMNCRRCAVGNLMAAAGVDFDVIGGGSHWLAYLGANFRDHPVDYTGYDLVLGLRQIEATGYSPEEIDRIEQAFERYAWGEGDKMFNGLMALVDVLADIHGVDLQTKESAKALFVKS